ncbi:hypothetical protein [Rossellomorea sp. RS05]|uniref:hypothetical protein n=1 Tax=Rossellomorea sp. RS05 TaxID=3149166 RepID=UPI00322182BB
MKLFHYHWWTDKIEEMEQWYTHAGFQTKLRIGRHRGEMEEFNPPLTWEEFRNEGIRFRIIEMVKGQVNVTFGQGKRDQFDHIGFLVSDEEYDRVIGQAVRVGWEIRKGERRTFLATPWRFRVELQRRSDAVEQDTLPSVHKMTIEINDFTNLSDLAEVLGANMTVKGDTLRHPTFDLQFINGESTKMKQVDIIGFASTSIDPVSVKVVSGWREEDTASV